jgi:magnesium-transporting ATPase (P-type)
MNRDLKYLWLLLLPTFTSCSAIEGIFKAGMIWGILLVVLFIGLILWIVSKARK